MLDTSRHSSVVNGDADIRLRRKRDARVVEDRGGVTIYPEPHVAPVLPPGWAPLEPEDEASVLQACDAAAQACRLRLGSVWDATCEYRVYCLDADGWRGVCVATVFVLGARGDARELPGRNTRLLAIAHSPDDAAHIAIDFLNWDLDADGHGWRLALKRTI
jgi:hypothetical protein